MPTIRQIREDINDTMTFYDVAEVLSSMASLAYANLSKLYDKNFLRLKGSVDDMYNFISQGLNFDSSDTSPDFLSSSHKKIAVIIGSNLGFCGKFNNELKYNYENNLDEISSYDNIFLYGRQLFAALETQHKISFPTAKNLQWMDVIGAKSIVVDSFIKELEDMNDDCEITVLSNGYNSETKKGNLSLRKFYFLNHIDINFSDYISQQGFDSVLNNTVLESGPQVFISSFLKYYLKSSLINIFVQSEIAENLARMNAMNQAKDEIELILKKLRRLLQKMRQAKITNELLEVIQSH